MKFIFLFVLFVKLTAEAKDGDCGVIPISTWGDSPLQRTEVLESPVNIAIVQHTATPECGSDEECGGIVNSIRRFHVDHLKFDDIAQSFLIGGNGRVYEGAGWHRVGAHTRSYNKRAIGISFIGDFRTKLPSPQALEALRNLLACGVVNSYLSENYHLVAHSQLTMTISPGEMLRSHVELWPHWLDNAKEILN